MSLRAAVKAAEVAWMDRRLVVVKAFHWVKAEILKACGPRTDGDMKR
jgi:hypothetical protein